MGLVEQLAGACRDARVRLDLSQQALADALGVSRSYITRIEGGTATVNLRTAERLSHMLGLRITFAIEQPVFLVDRRRHDVVHARCVATVARRLATAGWAVAREVDVSERGIHAWIDILAFHPQAQVLLVIEVKTRLDDLGGLERQLGWYERHRGAVARTRGWRYHQSSTWLVCLGSDEVESVIRGQRDLFADAFPGRAHDMLATLAGAPAAGRAIALIDPSSRRRAWLMKTRVDGRRSPAPYRDYAAAARRFARKQR